MAEYSRYIHNCEAGTDGYSFRVKGGWSSFQSFEVGDVIHLLPFAPNSLTVPEPLVSVVVKRCVDGWIIPEMPNLNLESMVETHTED